MRSLLWCTLFSAVLALSGVAEAFFISRSSRLTLSPVRRVTASGIGPRPLMRGSKDDEGAEVNLYEILSTVGQGGYVPVYLLKKFLGSKAITKSVGMNSALFYALFGAVDVLGNAYKRNRLDGTTFKYLNLGVFASSSIYFSKTFKSLTTMAMNPGELLGAALIFFCGSTAALKLNKYGLPNMKKLKMKGEKGCCPFSSKLFLLSGVTTLASAVKSLTSGLSAFGNPIGALQLGLSCALLPIISLVLHQAVLARRMRSKTYKDLNWILLLVSAISIVTAPSGAFALSSLAPEAALKSVDKTLFVLSHVSSVCAALLGLQIGYFGPEE